MEAPREIKSLGLTSFMVIFLELLSGRREIDRVKQVGACGRSLHA